MTKEQQRTEWIVAFIDAYAERITDGERMRLLSVFYDLAFTQGQTSEIQSHAEFIKAELAHLKGLQVQAL
jgi:hypothetical protein